MKKKKPGAPAVLRPGILSSTLREAEIRRLDEEEAFALCGLREGGIYIPYRDFIGQPIGDTGGIFGRLRLDRPKGKRKYHQRFKTGVHAYLPHYLRDSKPRADLILAEGEFKALSLCEAGFPAVGLPGLYATASNGEEIEIVSELRAAIEHIRPGRILYTGDRDTCLNWQFADAVMQFARLVNLPIVCPRIPLDAPGKGIDDCRQVLGEGFDPWFLLTIEEAVPVNPKNGREHLIVELLQRERDSVSKLARDDRVEAERKLVTMAAKTHKEPLEAARIKAFACETLGLSRQDFNRAVKMKIEQAAQGMEISAEERQATIEAAATGIYCYDAKYFRQEQNGCFERLTRDDALLHFEMCGLSDRARDGAREIKQALYRVQRNQRVSYAGPICGRPAGIHRLNGYDLLATASPNIIKAVATNSVALNEFFSGLYGEGVDHHFELQLITFIGWLQRAREALRYPEQHLPGHALILCGPPDCGKSLAQTLLTHLIGGRESDPSLWLTGETTFNDRLWAAEHLLMGDKSLAGDNRRRIRMRDEIKALVANPVYPLHPKGEAMLSLRPIWRITLSCNDDYESAQLLPSLNEGFRDKVILLRCYPPKTPFPTRTAAENARFFQMLLDDMPAFLHAVENFEVPLSIMGNRFGVKEFHHPALVELIADLSPVTPLGELIHEWTEQWTESKRSGPALTLYGQLREKVGATQCRGYVRDGADFARKLRQLSRLDGWKDRIEQSSHRFGPNKQKQTIWTIRRANPVKGDRGDRHFFT